MGFIFAAIGSAVGLGNIWRFSYLCYENGGGAFLIPYAIALFVVGIPLMILEMGIGHKLKGSIPLCLARIAPNWEWVGWWAVISAMFGIMLYYSVVIAWCLNYVFFSFKLSWGDDPNNFFFNEFLQVSSGPFDMGDIRGLLVLSLLAVWFLSWLIVYFGIQKGVERANKIFIPILFLLVAFLVVWSLSLEGAAEGIKVYLTPDWSALAEWKIWIDAFSQIFFTLSLGFGIMVVYASYLPDKTPLIKDASTICIANCLFSFFAGFAVFGTLGYMAHTTGQPIQDVVKESIGLAFVAYPQAISLIPAFAKLFGVVFFLSLVLAGLSSAISLVEAFASAMIDKFEYSRGSVVTTTCVIGFLGSMVFTTKGGLFWVDIVDHFITHYGLVLIGIFECILVGWVLKASKLREHLLSISDNRLWPVWDFCVKFVTPTILTGLFIYDIVGELSAPYENYSWVALILIGRDWLIVTLIAGLLVSLRPWKRAVKPLDE
jgi:NSS family neurotransmitter:Na+ symporter